MDTTIWPFTFALSCLLLAQLFAMPGNAVGSEPLPEHPVIRSQAISGASILSPPDNTSFIYAAARIEIPQTHYTQATGQVDAEEQRAVASVNICGQSKNGAGMQSGCTYLRNATGAQLNRCYYEFLPGPFIFYDNFYPSVGDQVLLEITRINNTFASSLLTNLQTGQAVGLGVGTPDQQGCDGGDVEWTVENPGAGSNFLNFDRQVFMDAVAVTKGGRRYNPGDVDHYLYQEWKNLTSDETPTQWTEAVVVGSAKIQVDWVGPD